MNEAGGDLLREVCSIIRSVDTNIASLRSERRALEFLFPAEMDQRALLELLEDESARALVQRLTRHAATAAMFHLLTVLDERKELGETRAAPRLILDVGSDVVEPPPDLHERLGAVMQAEGMDTEEWW